MKCYLIRHGITEGNQKLRFNGSGTNEPLTEEGRDALLRIEDVPEGAAIFASPLIRTVETAEILFPGIKPVIIEGIKEMHFGKLEGKNHEQLENDPDFRRWLESRGEMKIPGGESMKEFMARTGAALAEAYRTAADAGADCMYIVTHGGTIMALMSQLTGEDYQSFNVPNGAGYEIELTEDSGSGRLAAASWKNYTGALAAGEEGWIPPKYTPDA